MIIKPKGTYDIYGLESKKWQYVNNLIDTLCEKYNYSLIRTPIFEATELFHRGVCETTDIVKKETYDFIDRGNRGMTLRPEGTAGVIRSYIENKMHGDPNQPIKFYYNGTMYRYERPQSGRDRELTQFGIEVLGTNDPSIDAEIISLPVTLLKILGLKGIKVNINTLGDDESRNNYRAALIKYFAPHITSLCEDCQARYLNNPLRILDCKVDANNELLKNAPITLDYLNEASADRFNKVKHYLTLLKIEYNIDPRIVRGLDYYNHTVFEIEATVKDFGSNNVLAGGGRYNSLVANLDGPQTDGMGFAMGVGRLILALDKEEIKLDINETIDCFIMYVNDEEKEEAVLLTQSLRVNGFITEMEYTNRALKNQFKQAERLKAKYLIILNSEDLKNNIVTIKDSITKEETKLPRAKIVEFLDSKV